MADTGRLARIVDTILIQAPQGAQDMRWWDVLPAAVRTFIAEADAMSPYPQSAAAWAWALHEWGDTASLIEAVRRRLAALRSSG